MEDWRDGITEFDCIKAKQITFHKTKMNFSFIKYYLYLFILVVSLSGCNDTYISSIPDYPVSLKLDLASTYPTFKYSLLHYILFTRGINRIDYIGFGGIMVVTDLNGNYNAFDMSCPYEANRDILVYPNGPNDINGKEYVSNGQVVCEKCGSVFDITSEFGMPISGKAQEPLKKYKAILSGDVLYISPR